MPVPETSTTPIKVYWQPGCSSCLKTKEFLIEHDIEFESINVLEDENGFRELADLGLRLVPIVARGEDWANGAVFRDVARVAGFEWLEREMLDSSGGVWSTQDADSENEEGISEEGEFYLDELEGCAVMNDAGASLGVIREVLQPGANDVYVVARAGRSDLLLPAITGVVLEIRIADRTIMVDVPPGLDRDGTD